MIHGDEKGFALLQVALGMLVAGLLMGGYVAVLNAEMKREKVEAETKLNVDVHEALHEFMNRPQIDVYEDMFDGGGPVTAGWRYPCPADPNLPMTDPNFGVEETTNLPYEYDSGANDDVFDAACVATGGIQQVATVDGDVFIGALPVVTLGLGAEQMFDRHNNVLTYAVSANMTGWQSTVDKTAQGAITIEDERESLAPITISNAPYIIVSHGEDRKGAISNEFGGVLTACPGHGEGDAANCDGDATFRIAGQSRDIAANEYYDDAVSFNFEESLGDDIHWNLDDLGTANINDDEIFNTNAQDVEIRSSDLYVEGDDDSTPGDEELRIVAGNNVDAALIIHHPVDNTNPQGADPRIEMNVNGGASANITYRSATEELILASSDGVAFRANDPSGPVMAEIQIAPPSAGDVFITINSRVGVGGAPAHGALSLDLEGGLDVGYEGTPCNRLNPVNSTDEGAIRYDETAKILEFCDGIGWGAVKPDELIPLNGVCGVAHGVISPTMPAANLCTDIDGAGPYVPTPGSVTDTGLGWSWICGGQDNGVSPTCTALKAGTVVSPLDGVCGPADILQGGPTAMLAPSGNSLCATGQASPSPANLNRADKKWLWHCMGIAGGASVSCEAPFEAPVNGQCGTAAGTTFDFIPSSGYPTLCVTGNSASDVINNVGTLEWDCLGYYEQNGTIPTTVSCTANYGGP